MADGVVADPRVGTEVAGYAIESLLGRGGMGVVYLARDPWLERSVALKLVAPELAADPGFRERFLRESKLAASLEHAHVVPIYEAGEDADALYLAMRYIEGSDLGALLEERYQLDPKLALQLLTPVAIALDAAHAKGLVHRDVKPGNILLSGELGDGYIVYLSDFGLTTRADDVALAGQDELSGTLDYAAPEQIRGAVQTAQTDVYALGCVLFECLCGVIPFPGESQMAKMFAHLEADRPRPSAHGRDLPEALDAVIARALAKQPEARHASCADLVAAAARALGHAGDLTSDGERRRPAPAALRNPYKGLRGFEEHDADDFFGREALIDELKGRLVDERLLAVVGPSGSGKSSAVHAGLLPALRGDQAWRVAEMVPGGHPIEELEAALLRLAPDPASIRVGRLREDRDGLVRCAESIVGATSSHVLLVVDQFEELFTLVLDSTRRDWFLELLCAAAMDPNAPIRIVITLRADFFDRPLRIRNLAELVEAGQVTVLPLSPGELEQAITAPAERVGLRLEQGLVADIVADVIDQPGALPLLQHALSELYESRDDGLLSTQAYRSIGGVSGALSRRAEEIYSELSENGQLATRNLFTRLVALGEGTEDTRRRVLRSEVEAIAQGADAMPGVLDAFGRQRLLAFDRDLASQRPTVEISHEALLREWPRLRVWIDDDRDGLRLLRHVSESATAWDRLEREPSELYGGSRLDDALAWRAEHPGDLNPLEGEFLDASREQSDAEKLADVERARQRLKQNRRLRVALAIVALALAGAIAGAVVALDQRGTANEQTDRAEAEAVRANEAADLASAQ